MHSGLEKILAKIAGDPANRVLMERYVALVRELGDERLKIEYILKLARSLIESDPRSAMEFAFSVFQYDSKNLKALEIISGCLKILGRFGKSEVIKNEVAKIRKLQKENKIDNELAERFVSDVSVIRIDHSIEGQKVGKLSGLPDDAFVPDLPIDPKATVPIDNNFKPKPMVRSVAADPQRPQQDQVKLELNLGQEKAVVPRQPQVRDADALEDVAPIGTVTNHQDNIRNLRQSSVAQVQSRAIQEPSEGTVIRNEIAAQVRELAATQESMPAAWTGSELSVLVEQFEFFFKQGMMVEAEKLLSETAPFAKQMTWWKARRAILDTIAVSKRIPACIPDSMPVQDEAPTDLDHSAELKQWQHEVQILIANGKSRKALIRLRKDLERQVDVSWGKAAMGLLNTIWSELGLQGFRWEPSDGMAVFNERLKRRQPGRLTALINKSPKNSA